MGREWLYWGSSNKSRKRPRSSSDSSTTASAGCITSVLQIFDLNHCYFPNFPLNHPNSSPSFLPQTQDHHPKGVETPRNSLESEEDVISLSPPTITKHELLNIPPMGIQVKTSIDARSSRTDDLSSEFSSSPSTKTPNLVARLMGLDLLPETSSPSSSSSSSSKLSRLHPRIQNLKEEIRCSRKSRSATHKSSSETDFSGTRSLPETPRISSARRSDVDHHRYSLQSNKENSEEIEFSSYLTAKLTRRIVHEDENRSPGHYARQIVKQVKESISRRVGTDITNNVKNREQRRDQDLVVLLKSKKSSTKSAEVEESTQVTQSRSPRLRLLELKENKLISSSSTSSKTQKILAPSPLSSPNNVTVDDKYLQCRNVTPTAQKNTNDEKCKKVRNEKYNINSRVKKHKQTTDLIRNKQDESFVRSPPKIKCKQTPLSSNFLNINVPTSKFQGKKQSEVHKGQSSKSSSQLSRNLSHSYELEATHTHSVQINNNNNRFSTASTVATANGGGSEIKYISSILNRTGIGSNTIMSFTDMYSASHALDPSIFHQLENSWLTATTATTATTSALDNRSNRKLIFELVDELLVEIFKPYTNSCEMNGSELIEQLCCRIREFPSADCKVLEDIDRLIGGDLQRRTTMVEEEEILEMVTEMEREIMEEMVHETAMVFRSVRTLKRS